MSATAARFPFPKEATVHNQLLMFFTEREFKKKFHTENAPSASVREVFRTWALCFRDDSQIQADERISIDRFFYAADFSVVRWQHENERESRYQMLNTVGATERRNKVLWYWMLVVARRIFCKRYKRFLDEALKMLTSSESCVCLTTWDPSWMDEIQNKCGM
ncbi:MAG: hypothetical protein IPK84_02250 [Candidatus Moraniibacteriota bacterium]|nr:MAG: hypothetical protein IPK84_02250 [Candidatus Moranbacteria bacterium]